MGHMLTGCFTVQDQRLYTFLCELADREQLYLEPSALAGFFGPIQLLSHHEGQNYLIKHNLQGKMNNAIHLVWGTGGNMVPEEVMEKYYQKGKKLIR